MADNFDDFIEGINESELQEGAMKKTSLEGTPVLFIKQNGKIYAINNRCPHQACGFNNGKLDGSAIICPCHDWRFSLETGEYEQKPAYKLHFYEWKIAIGKIWVRLDDDY
jgi:nitrite reductase/ring-hydroxylating ferredoxin subunit